MDFGLTLAGKPTLKDRFPRGPETGSKNPLICYLPNLRFPVKGIYP
ncbi:hypothetical protein LEP1GSC058_0345 [Leptospira fainei serovar Hurstbridge str. BUT 6]|uniref:Uncharacterized protein n=1 Tax=Leptospira fainei serovar Hurstbridge str. BUT 6 TaxID=1193011 RepID=S3W754_9LEPT|nr:hypothetical protein LEP1GSC058_0345 [Leptospira fainei serovar Hurstbridge str. BUT 6]